MDGWMDGCTEDERTDMDGQAGGWVGGWTVCVDGCVDVNAQDVIAAPNNLFAIGGGKYARVSSFRPAGFVTKCSFGNWRMKCEAGIGKRSSSIG